MKPLPSYDNSHRNIHCSDKSWRTALLPQNHSGETPYHPFHKTCRNWLINLPYLKNTNRVDTKNIPMLWPWKSQATLLPVLYIRSSRTKLVLRSLCLPAPVVGIWIKDKLRLIRESYVENKGHEKHSYKRCPLHPCCASITLMIWSKRQEDKEKKEKELDSLTDLHGWYIVKFEAYKSCAGVV